MGTAPLVLAGGSAEHETTALGFPRDAASLRVQVDAVTFADDTTWERE